MIPVLILLILEAAVWTWGRRTVLPPQHVMVEMNESDIRNLVLRYMPLGTDKPAVEKALRNSFRRKWEEITCESVEAMSQRRFQVPVVDGDYFLRSDFAAFGPFLPRVVTVHFLLDETGQLRDVAPKIWDETL
jgi:hypothetical protein